MEWEKEFSEVFPCINSGCDNRGAIQIAEDEWEQCQYCYEVRFPVKAFIQAQINKAKVDLLEEIEQCYSMDMGDYIEISHKNFEQLKNKYIKE